MNEQQDDREQGTSGNEGGSDQRSAGRRPFSAGGMVGGAVMFALLYVIDKLRPSRRRKSDENEQTGQIPASETPAAGSYETITGSHPAPPGVHESLSSPWPVVVAGAVAFTAFGIVTNYAFSLFGIIVMIVGIAGWVGELIRE